MRCDQIKQEAKDKFTSEMYELSEKSKKQYCDQFGLTATQMIHQIMQFYQSKANEYVKRVYEEKEVELMKEIHSEIQELVNHQSSHHRKQLFNDLDSSIKGIDLNSQDYEKQVKTLNDAIVNSISSNESMIHNLNVCNNEQ